MASLKLYNAIFFAAYGSIMPFLVLYYEDLGLAGRQIGLLNAFPSLMVLFGSAIWGALADLTSRHRRIFLMAIIGSSTSGLLIGFTTRFQTLIPIVLVYAFFVSPIVPLLDNSVLEALKERSDQYGKFRLWGAVGWGLATPTVGAISDHFGLSWCFYIFLALMGIGFFVARRMPVAQAGIGSDFRRGLGLLIRARRTQIFLLTMLFVGLGLSLIDVFLFLHLRNLGASNSLMGLTLSVGTMSEIVLFLNADRLIRRLGTARLLTLAIFALGIQLLGYSLISKPQLALIIQILHGPAFAGMWSAGVAIARQVAPKGMGATAQGLYSSVTFGIGGMTGSILGGVLIESMGTAHAFTWFALCVLLSGLFFLWISGERSPLKLELG